MPERDKQTDAMARTLAGAPPRAPLARLGTKPAEITDAQWDAAQTLADRVYVDLVEAIDFQRVLIEAMKRHLTVHPGKRTLMASADIGVGTAEALCHSCITEVLLATDTNPPWAEQAESPRYLHYDPLAGQEPLVAVDPFTDLGGWDDEQTATNVENLSDNPPPPSS